MNNQYSVRTTNDRFYYSNMNSYGSSGQPIPIIAPVLVSQRPEIFSHLKPHSLPEWMLPKKINRDETQVEKCIPCNPYSCLSDHNTKCDHY
uniref:Uncharacterized protein n=1 Tax=viral metagenome TaxID=1070528 RepID=A0A6C0H2G6_9ZZZZ